MEEELREAALDYHRFPTPGKIALLPTKALTNQRELGLAYSPGVAYASLAIKDDPLEAASMTSRANLVAVVTNGTAVLGLGNIGSLRRRRDRCRPRSGCPMSSMTEGSPVAGRRSEQGARRPPVAGPCGRPVPAEEPVT